MRHVTFLLALFIATVTALAQPATRPATRPATQPTTQPTGGFLGARLGTMNDRIADQLGMDVDWGVIVGPLVADGPAANAGIEERDVIQKIDGEAVRDLPAFQQIMRDTKPGQEVTFTVVRGGEFKEVKVALGVRPANVPAAPSTRPG